jgi:hypothetical protein
MILKAFRTISLISIASFFAVSIQAQDIQPYKAQDIKPYKSEEIKSYKAKETTPETFNKVEVRNTPVKINLEGFAGLYQYWVPGTSSTVPDYNNQQVVIHNSTGTGVLPGGIKINPDQTYVWNSSWDEKVIKGRWRKTADSDYPIELENAQGGKNWRIGKSKEKGVDIVIWDGSTWYNGRKLK